MAGPSVSAVYIDVVEDVVDKMRDEFVTAGAEEGVLDELQGLWEMKLMQCGAITGSLQRPSVRKSAAASIAAVHDLNVPFGEYQTPTAELLFPPTPLETPLQTPLPSNVDQNLYHLPTPSGQSDYDESISIENKPGKPSPYMQPPSPWMNQRPLGVDVNVAYAEGRDDVERGISRQFMTQDFLAPSFGKRKRDDYAENSNPSRHIPQQDGAGEISLEVIEPARSVPQQDGIHDGYHNFSLPGAANQDYHNVVDHGVHVNICGTQPTEDDAVEDDEPPLNEDDDVLDDLDQVNDELDTRHLVLAQFDKVTRTKNKWKCTLKDGIMHINNKDILFHKASGDFDF